MVVNQILCVAEKPSISKSVAQILSGGQLETKSTKNQYIKNYQFNCMYEGRQSQVTMTALLGHLMEYEFPPEYKQWNNSSTPQLFEATLLKRVKSNMQDLADNLKRQSRYCQLLVIWTDCDRYQRQNIGAEVVGICQSVNPNIIVKRARFSVVQHRDIQTAWNSLVNLDMNAAKAVDARSELDLRIGAVFTRFQTVNLKPKFQDLADQKVLSYGPCQFPTLGFVVDRFLKAKHFVEEPFWKIDLTVSKDGIDTKFHWDRAHLFDHHMTLVLYEMCIDASVGVIKKVTSKPKSKWAPLPLTTVELQKIGSRTLRISSDKIMHIAEALYNQGIISYPRTETDSFSPTFDLKSLIEKQVNDPNWGQYAKGLLDGKFRFPRKGKRDDQAHPPIHPVRGALTLQGDERKVYDFVTRRFLACCSDSAKGNETIVDLTMADESFTAKGKPVISSRHLGLMIIERNFLDVYPFEKWSDSQVGVFTEGETVEPSILEMNEGSTNKPNMLTEADLINIMDKSGIGTDSTIHEHIKKILEREYANKEGDYFFPTTLGMALVCGYDSMNIELSLSKPDLRALMEQNMKYICEGRKTKESVLREVIDMYKSAFDTAQAQMDVLVAECNKFMTPIPFQQQADATTRQGVYVRHCPKCKMQMLLKSIKGNDAKKMIGK
ncbi:DNA topoisomerase [Globomyces pollinis-pini]|nr:DNA topoisomerase [Globomyces pollinis-pini]